MEGGGAGEGYARGEGFEGADGEGGGCGVEARSVIRVCEGSIVMLNVCLIIEMDRIEREKGGCKGR